MTLRGAVARSVATMMIVVGLIGCGGDDGEPTEVGPVSAEDSVVNDIPQNAALEAEVIDGVLTVTNSGNVTISEVSADGSACEPALLAPGESANCDDFETAWTVTGVGPQGQSVEVNAS